MVSTEAKWILANINLDPKIVADVWGIDEDECWRYIEDLHIELRIAEKERQEYLPTLHKELREWVESIPNKNNIRIDAIKEQLIDAKTNPQNHDVERLILEVKILKGTTDRVTDEMIDKAKQFPIESLIEVKRKVALCPFHNEKTPSLSIHNNKYHCFGCGESGDTISLVRHLNNYTFKQAVEFLQ